MSNAHTFKTNLNIKTFYKNTITNIECNKKSVNDIIIEEFSPDVSTDDNDEDDDFENLNSEEKEFISACFLVMLIYNSTELCD